MADRDVQAPLPLPHRLAQSPEAPSAAPGALLRTTRTILTPRRVYILPTRHGLLFAATLLFLLLGSINYNLSLGYVLTFLLAGLGLTAMLHTWRNIARLEVGAGRAEPVFAGEHAHIHVVATNHDRFERVAIGIDRVPCPVRFVDVPAADLATLTVHVPASRRGWLPLGPFRLFTTHPLGLFRAWAKLELDLRCLVYPAPEPGNPPLPPPTASLAEGGRGGQGGDDFAGLREYRPGDSPRHVAWKAAARDGSLRTKAFDAHAGPLLWLDWAALPDALSAEQKLARLTRWVLSADAARMNYGLRLPGREIGLDNGPAHRSRCLEALATFGPDARAP